MNPPNLAAKGSSVLDERQRCTDGLVLVGISFLIEVFTASCTMDLAAGDLVRRIKWV